MKYLLMALVTIALAGCGNPSTNQMKQLQQDREWYMERVTFHKHPSGLCFAMYVGGHAVSISNIPCVSGDTVFVKTDTVPVVKVDTVYIEKK